MKRLTSSLFVIILLAGCSAKPVLVNYTAPVATPSDWYPIPADAPAQAELTSPEVPRIFPELETLATVATDQPLTVDWVTDSLGNRSLLLNRPSGASWELLESAMDQLNIAIFDKNRDEYRFELATDKPKKGLFNLFKTSEELNVVLIPRGNSTVVAVEGKDDIAPEEKDVDRILNQLMNHFQANS